MTTWDYEQWFAPPGNELAVCQERGREGWELVALVPGRYTVEGMPQLNGDGRLALAGGRHRLDGAMLYFKRSVPLPAAAVG